jgi:hypothetical protein
MDEPFAATAREEYELLARTLKETRDGLIDYSFKHGTILTLIIGWIVSSGTTQEFLKGSVGRKLLGSAFIGAYWILYTLWTVSWYRRSVAVYQHLIGLKYMPPEYYHDLRIPPVLVASFIALHALGCLVAIYFVLSL